MTQANTFLDAVVAQLLEAGEYNRNDQVALPLCSGPTSSASGLLWSRCCAIGCLCSRWVPMTPRSGQALPIGCAVWRAGHCPMTNYWAMACRSSISGYGKQDLRAIESCPKPLQPLAELQYRGTLWVHRNGRDWTVAGFLHNLGIPVLADNETKMALPACCVWCTSLWSA